MKALMKQHVPVADTALSSVTEAALTCVSVREEDLTSLLWKRCGTLYEVIFSTDWVLYDTFVDPESMEVHGINTMPVETF